MIEKRYFFVSYAHTRGFGRTIWETNGVYVNSGDFCQQVSEDQKLEQLIILNIIELSENDKRDFLGEGLDRLLEK